MLQQILFRNSGIQAIEKFGVSHGVTPAAAMRACSNAASPAL
jgi:hypothetical protein